MQNANFFAPGFDEQVEQQNIERQRKMADLLRQQSSQGMGDGRMVGRHYVAPHWLEGVAQMLQAGSARRMDEQATEQQRKLADAIKTKRDEEWGKITPLLNGEAARDIQPLTPNDDEGNAMPVVHKDAVAPNVRGAYTAAMQSSDPALRQFGFTGMAQLPEIEQRRTDRAEERAWRTQEAEEARKARIQQLEMQHQQRMDTLAAQNASEDRRAAEQRAFQMEMKKLYGSQASQQPYFQPVQTANGVMAFNARTGKMEPVVINGAPVIGSQSDPKLQGDITGAKEAAKAKVETGVESAKAVKRIDQLNAAASKAMGLLDDGPTNSGVGAAVDYVGNKFGVSSKSAEKAAELEGLSGWLVANVPRMEGPQSNIDVLNYQTMAGKVGDRTVPVEQRRAALKGMIDLQNKYRALNEGTSSQDGPTATAPAKSPEKTYAPSGRNPGVPQAPAAPAAPKRIKYDAQGNPIK